MGSSSPAVPLRCVFYSKFDNISGPVIVCQEPPGVITPPMFVAISGRIIVGDELAGRILVTTAFGLDLVVFPVHIEGSHYERNKFSFALGMAFLEGSDYESFRQPLAKLGTLFMDIEKESLFLSDPKNLPRVEAMLGDLYQSLRDRQEWQYAVDPSNVIYLRLFPRLPDPPAVRGHHVPVLLQDPAQIPNRSPSWGPTLDLVVSYIDGVSHVKRLSAVSGVELELVCRAVQNLVYYGLAALVDVFQFSNTYVPTPSVGDLLRKRRMQRECLRYIVCRDPPRQPELGEVFRLYCSFSRGVNMASLARSNPLLSEHVVDPRRLVVFGVLNGLISRVHQYPLPRGVASAFRPTVVNQEVVDAITRARGTVSLDELCCDFGINHAELDAQIRQDPNLVFVYK